MKEELVVKAAYLIGQEEICTPEYLSRKMHLELKDAKKLYKNVLRVVSTPLVSGKAARANANEYLIGEVGDAFSTREPEFVRIRGRPMWLISILLSYPGLGSIGRVGEIMVDGISGKIVGMTPIYEIDKNAERLYKEHKDEIEGPVS